MNTSIDRRHLLKAASVSVALPWLESTAAVTSASEGPPPRTVFICTALGLHGPALYPKTPGTRYESTEYLDLLKPHRDDFTLFSGLSHPDQGGEHLTLMTFLSAARNPGLDGFQNSISIDMYAAEQLGYATRFPSIALSTDGPLSQSYTSSGVMVPAEHSPARLFAKMFLKGSPQEIAKQKRQLEEGRSILDQLRTQARLLEGKISKSDRARMDEYLSAIRTTELDLSESRKWMDKPKPSTDTEPPKDIYDRSDLVGRTQLLMNMVPLILQSDSSRIVSIVIQDHHLVPQVDGVSVEHHNLSHHGQEPDKIAQLKKIEKHLLGCFGDLIGNMKRKSEGDASLLESTAILFGSNLGNANAHDPRNLPIFLAGGGYDHGKYVAFDKDDNTPLSNLFVNLLNRMDINADRFATSSGRLDW